MMICPAVEHYFNSLAVFDNAEVGDVFNIDSGLGGSHTVVFDGKTEDGNYVFHCPARNDWPARTFRIGPDHVLSEVYILLPERSYDLERNMKIVEIKGKKYAVEMTCGVVWVRDPEGYFRFNKTDWSLAYGKDADEARRLTSISRQRNLDEIRRQNELSGLGLNKDLHVARVILDQLGGSRFIAMTGANSFAGGADYLMFRLPRKFAKNGINKVKISLHWTDTYIVEAMRLGPLACEIIESTESVYAEDLQGVLTSMTGLDTSL